MTLVTVDSLTSDLCALGITEGRPLMVHSSLKSLGHVLGGAPTVISALIRAIGPLGTLVMPAFSPQISDPARWQERPFPQADLEEAQRSLLAFDPDTTPTPLGIIPETFRRWPGTLRSAHPQVSVCARGPLAGTILSPHDFAWAQGPSSPFERLYELDSDLVLIGVGFNRATLLHYAESRAENRREKIRCIPVGEGSKRHWVEAPDVADDLGAHFPALGTAYLATGHAQIGRIGKADAILVRARSLVDFATDYFTRVLA